MLAAVAAFLSFLLLFSFFVEAVNSVENRCGAVNWSWTEQRSWVQSGKHNTQRLATNDLPWPRWWLSPELRARRCTRNL